MSGCSTDETQYYSMPDLLMVIGEEPWIVIQDLCNDAYVKLVINLCSAKAHKILHWQYHPNLFM